MSNEIKIERKASEVYQPEDAAEARQFIQEKKDLTGANLASMDLHNLNAVGAVLRKTNLERTDLSHGLLVKPNFYKASLRNAAIHNTIFLGGDFVKTNLKDADLADSVLYGVDGENASFERANLRNAVLVNADMTGADFSNVDFSGSRFVSVNVKNADFSNANMTGALAHNVNWDAAKVPPPTIPELLLKMNPWVGAVLLGSLVGILALVIYVLWQRSRKNH